MSCPRCHGLLVIVDYRDQECFFSGVRCLNCGWLTDAVMRRNRQHPPPDGWSPQVYRLHPGEESAYDRRRG